VLAGNGGADLFAFGAGSGADTVADFDGTAGDRLQILSNANGNGIGSFPELASAISEDAGGNAMIDLGSGNSITLVGVRSAELSETDFLFT